MTKKQNEQLKQAIIKAVPEIMKLNRPIRLADVLILWKKIALKVRDADNNPIHRAQILEGIIDRWDLTKDLDGQSNETKQFLWELLCK